MTVPSFISIVCGAVVVAGTLGGCTCCQSDEDGEQVNVRTGEPEFVDLTRSAEAHDAPVDRTNNRTFVPWDSAAVLEVRGDDESHPGALVVRYGLGSMIDAGGAATIYVLEPAGQEFEPISIDWQPGNGSELRAIARVNGELRRYDFDR